jgi:hypothetical protein
MPDPVLFPCGGPNQPACPPTTSASTTGEPLAYTLSDMHAYGLLNYEKGLKDAKK